jgi:RNA polymerase sigma factor (sigma-70 family)
VSIPSDRELVERCVTARDEGAFRTLYRRHTPILLRVAARFAADHGASADDLVHETWVRASDRWARLRWESSLRTWLTGILLNVVRESRRRLDASPDPLSDDLADAESLIDHRLDLADAVARLAPGYRAVLVMHDIEGYTHQDIAGSLGIEVGTSKSQLTRARRILRRWLDPDWRPA